MGTTAKQLFDQGWAEGVRGVLKRQLRVRFGALTPAARRRLRTADASTLEAWAEHVLTAERLEDVFAPAGRVGRASSGARAPKPPAPAARPGRHAAR
ncbi:MAG: DUF4351 domain-containing protein [Planctomycetes bacterium]|nr:DUF4351 domain-containing protein [Planctomycetota bacterium]